MAKLDESFDDELIEDLEEDEKPEEEEDLERLEEEFCLMYVGCTRAKKSLKMYMQYMAGTAEWSQRNKISRFIKQVYATSKEKYFTLKVLDVTSDTDFKKKLLVSQVKTVK